MYLQKKAVFAPILPRPICFCVHRQISLAERFYIQAVVVCICGISFGSTINSTTAIPLGMPIPLFNILESPQQIGQAGQAHIPQTAERCFLSKSLKNMRYPILALKK